MMRDGLLASLLSLGFLVACGDSGAAGDGSGAGASAGRSGGGADSGSSSTTSTGGDDDAGPGASSDAGGSSGAGGAAGSGGAGHSGAGGGAGAGSSLTPYDACVRYVDAECNRFDRECVGGSAVDNPCAYRREFCPDVYFAEGSLQTVDDLVACAETWAGHPCELARKGIRPECLTPGSLPVGTPCAVSSQCESLYCAYTENPGCRRCKQRALRDGACNAMTDCPLLQTCRDGTCVTLIADRGVPLDAPCSEQLLMCGIGLACLADAASGQTHCRPLPTVGESCMNALPCAAGVCDAGTCVALPNAGQPCHRWLDDYFVCAEGLYCDERGAAPTCTARKAAGESCSPTDFELKGAQLVQIECAAGLFCDCANMAGCVGTCRAKRWAGEDCAQANTACATGTTCEAGICRGVASQGLISECN
jgi:hypothetical protein